ncbi:hypothetical protein QR685DRAFT_447449, partial [Neurospora intermedia]
TSLHPISTNRTNWRLINTSIYLLQHKLKIYYILGKLNFILNALNYLYIK